MTNPSFKNNDMVEKTLKRVQCENMFSDQKLSIHRIMLNSVELNLFYFLAFYVEKTGSGECPLICTMRCELGDQNDCYYLCADNDGKLFLLVSIEEFVSIPS